LLVFGVLGVLKIDRAKVRELENLLEVERAKRRSDRAGEPSGDEAPSAQPGWTSKCPSKRRLV
jgi:hypothetical protein